MYTVHFEGPANLPDEHYQFRSKALDAAHISYGRRDVTRADIRTKTGRLIYTAWANDLGLDLEEAILHDGTVVRGVLFRALVPRLLMQWY